MNSRLLGRFVQGEDEQIPYQIITTNWGVTPGSIVAVAKSVTDGYADVTATVMPGTPTASGDTISLPVLKSLTAGKFYRVEVKFTPTAGGVFEGYFEVTAEM
jgi:hypothetical protein